MVRVRVCFDGLGAAWENIPSLRRLADAGKGLMVPTVPGMTACLGSLKEAKENYHALKAVLQIMAAAGSVDTPGIEVLSGCCRNFLELGRYPIEADIPMVAHRDAWSLKRCLTFLRRKWARQEYPKDCLSNTFWVIHVWKELNTVRAANMVEPCRIRWSVS